MSKKSKNTATGQFVPDNLDKLLGSTGVEKFGTLDIQVFATRLKSMELDDLHKYALQHGIRPVNPRQDIIETLTKMFVRHVNQFSVGMRVEDRGQQERNREIFNDRYKELMRV